MGKLTRGQREAAFWSKVDKGDACWSWTGAMTTAGYGSVWIGHGEDKAHRVSWRMANGAIPDGAYVLHRCDNRLCVRPDHLFLGTHGDNMADMVAKQRARGAVGQRNRHAKLTEDDVINIRTVEAIGGGRLALARAYGVAKSTVENIVARRTWRHVP